MKRKQATAMRSAKLRRPFVRRLRAAMALLALIAVAIVLVGVGFAATGQGFALLISAVLCAAAAVGALVLMAPGRVRHVPIAAERVVEATPSRVGAGESPVEIAEIAEAAVAAHAAAQAAAAERIDRARKMARARSERPSTAMKNQPQSILLHEAAQDEAKSSSRESAKPRATGPTSKSENDRASVTSSAKPASTTEPAASSRQRSQRIAQAERLRRMGVIGDTSDGMLDLDAVLRQRRSAG